MADPLRAALDRAVAAGVLTADQATAVAALEEQHAVGRRSVLAEVLGYVGGALALVAGLLLGQEVWDELGPGPRVLVLAAVALATLAAGALLGGRDGPAGRLGGSCWFAAVAATGAATAVAAADLLGAGEHTAALASTGAALAVAAVLWWRRPETLQQLAAIAAAAATLVALLHRIDPAGAGVSEYAGPLVGLLGACWLAAAAAGRARPVDVGWVLGGTALVGGLLSADAGRPVWLLVAVLAATGLIAAGVRGHRPWVIAVGTVGLLVAVPLAVSEYVDAELGALTGVLVVGLALLLTAVVLVRRAARPRS